MPSPQHPQKQQYSGTYFVQDRENEEELLRLAIQDRLVTASMGGVLPEQPDPSAFLRVLDGACGAGSWAIEAAQTYPEVSLVGGDFNQRMSAYAPEQAPAHNINDRVGFD